MDKNDIGSRVFSLSLITLGVLILLVADGNRTEKTIACIEAGMEWIDGDCVKGEKE